MHVYYLLDRFVTELVDIFPFLWDCMSVCCSLYNSVQALSPNAVPF